MDYTAIKNRIADLTSIRMGIKKKKTEKKC